MYKQLELLFMIAQTILCQDALQRNNSSFKFHLENTELLRNYLHKVGNKHFPL